ncbi:inositol monophosphatase [bacterium SCSIO 12741]|nr:inositol monophosphatase [bacterium SCSIO 12741]
MKLETIHQQVLELTRSTGQWIKNERVNFSQSSVELKGLHNYVTYVDKQAEEKLVEGLKAILPEAGFIAEEGTASYKGEHYNWIIDPIDGTTNFIHGIPIFSISIALQEDDKTILGVVYEINADEMFHSHKGIPAYLNETEIRVTPQTDHQLSLLATGFPYHDYDLIDQYLGLLKHFMETTSGLRRLGSAAVDLAYVACGRMDGFFEYGLNPWDVAGGAFLVQQAGGQVSDWQNGNDYLFGEQILASNGHLQAYYLDSIQQFFPVEK